MEKFALYTGELKKWNRKINLTAIKSDEDIALKHFVDSLTLTRLVKKEARLLDIGSGAGFPCIPLKIVLPDLQVVSVDAVEKKIFFQRHLARVLALRDFEAIHGRAEGLRDQYEEYFDIIVSRAFSDIPTFAALALPLLKQDGIVVAMKGKDGHDEAIAASDVLESIGGVICDIQEFLLPITGDGRCFAIIAKKST